MPPEQREWTVPAPLRALLWWPAAAFVLVVIAPQVAAGSIAVAGVLLMTLGALGTLVPAAPDQLRSVTRADADRQDDPVTELPAVEMQSRRAA